MKKMIFLLALTVFLSASSVQATSYIGVDVRIEAGSETIYNNTVYISDGGCVVVDAAEVERNLSGFNALCALEAASQDGDFEYSGTYGDYGYFLSSISSYETPMDFSEYWGTYANVISLSSSLDMTTLADGDELLLTFGAYDAITPVRLTLDETHRVAGQDIVASVDYFVTTDWETGEGEYQPLSSAIVYVGDAMYATDEAGTVTFAVDEVGTYSVYADAEGYTQTAPQSVVIYAPYSDVIAYTTSVPTTEERVRDAVAYLERRTVDGLVDDTLAYTEWAVQGIARARALYGNDVIAEETYQAMRDRVRAYQPTAADGASEIARHILALESLGMDARNIDGANYVKRLKKTFVGGQFGDVELCNDDIFAGLALLSADVPMQSRYVRKAMRASLTCQQDDGGFGYSTGSLSEVDTTAAWLMLAGQFRNRFDEHGIALGAPRAAALAYMKDAQHPDGGWGYQTAASSNSSSTAWAVMGYRAHGKLPENRTKNQLSGIDFMNQLQGGKGGMQYNEARDYSVVVLNTAYAILAWTGSYIGE